MSKAITPPSSSPFARIQYEQARLDLLALRGSMAEVSDRKAARAWAEAFGKLHVRIGSFRTSLDML